MLYRAVRPFLFALDPETAHGFSLKSLDFLHHLGVASQLLRPALFAGSISQPTVHVMGLDFPNPVGLAAGLDKNGEHIDGLAALGFGFLEIGAVTPRPQPGNPKPRLFRIPEAEALINRLGFNNRGVDVLAENLRRSRYRGVLGINVGKNFDTPNERAADDYVACLRHVYPYASFVTANVSSPNTKDLRSLQQPGGLDALLAALTAERDALAKRYGNRVPLAVKIAPDIDDAGIEAIADRVRARGIDAVIATNTTVSREGLLTPGVDTLGPGGISGAPVARRSAEVLRRLYQRVGDRLVLISVGGIETADDAWDRITSGASLVQGYTGFIYAGGSWAKDIHDGLARRLHDGGFASLADAVGSAVR